MKKHLFLLISLCIVTTACIQAAEEQAESAAASELNNCVICLDREPVVGLLSLRCCKKTFHANCLNQWFGTAGRNCPHCRRAQPQPTPLIRPEIQPQVQQQDFPPVFLSREDRRRLSEARTHWLN